MKNLLITLSAVILFGCVTNPKNAAKKDMKPLIVIGGKDNVWGGDIRLSLTDSSENDTARIYKALSSSDKGNLGVRILITKKPVNSQGFGNAITLESIGAPSDLLLHKLAELYKQNIPVSAKFPKRVQASFVDLSQFTKSLGLTANDGENIKKYKLFFETQNDEGELFLNINSNENWLELREKDEEYRPVMIKVFTQ